MSSNHVSQEEAERIRRGRIKLILMFLIAGSPLVFATVMYYTGWGLTAGATNRGALVEQGFTAADTGLMLESGAAFESLMLPENEDAKWHILILADPCGEACLERLHLTRQVHLILHRNAERVRRSVWVAEPDQLPLEEHPEIYLLNAADVNSIRLPEGRRVGPEPQVYIVDPIGNFVLRYGPEHSGEDIREDLKLLLKASPLG